MRRFFEANLDFTSDVPKFDFQSRTGRSTPTRVSCRIQR